MGRRRRTPWLQSLCCMQRCAMSVDATVVNKRGGQCHQNRPTDYPDEEMTGLPKRRHAAVIVSHKGTLILVSRVQLLHVAPVSSQLDSCTLPLTPDIIFCYHGLQTLLYNSGHLRRFGRRSAGRSRRENSYWLMRISTLSVSIPETLIL